MNMAIGKPHLIWENVDNNTVDVKRGITKARMLTGVYMLHSTNARFNQYDVEQICPTCRLATEDLQHMLTRCPALSEARSPLLSSIRVLLSRRFGVAWWSSRSIAQIVTLCLDSSNINDQINHSVEGSFLCRLETALCFYIVDGNINPSYYLITQTFPSDLSYFAMLRCAYV